MSFKSLFLYSYLTWPIVQQIQSGLIGWQTLTSLSILAADKAVHYRTDLIYVWKHINKIKCTSLCVVTKSFTNGLHFPQSYDSFGALNSSHKLERLSIRISLRFLPTFNICLYFLGSTVDFKCLKQQRIQTGYLFVFHYGSSTNYSSSSEI